ncbi:MAG TPA: N-acetylmuramoyl-L-alanine amidase [Thermoanaerobaculia bacterium]|nr:N-acetylmuramoyl-L-alanine amidase [Thermoanaerobaculia bacterium]
MSNREVSPLKRRLLQEVVRDNVDHQEGRLPPPLRPRRFGGRWTAGALALVLLPTLFLGSSRLISSFNPPAPPASSRVAAGAPASPPPPTIPAAPARVAAVAPETRVQLTSEPEPVGAEVFPLAVRKVAIDPGHGGTSLGTHTTEMMEKELTLDVAVRLRKLLEADGFEVLMTRQSDAEVDLAERGTRANQAGADIFVSIHVNWMENRDARGIETYYLGPTNDPYLTRLTAAENHDSGYSLADMRDLLDRLYAGVRQDNSRKLAEVIQSSLYHSLRKVNPQLQDRGVKAAPFIVLLTTEMPAILAEVSCLSNREEAELLSRPLYRQYIAEALAAGVRSYADTVEGKPEGGPNREKGMRSQ